MEVLAVARDIWGGPEYAPEKMAVALGVVSGDVHRQVRCLIETGVWDEGELKKELGNLILSSVRWCDDLGFDPRECIQRAESAQRGYVKALGRLPER